MNLIYFTYSFPSGNTISWKKNELEVLSKGFEKIEVVPFFNIKTEEPGVALPSNIVVHPNLLEKDHKPSFLSRLLKVVSGKSRKIFLKEFFEKKVYRNRKHFIDWTIDSYHIYCLLNHPLVKKLGEVSDDKTIWYFFWGRHPALLIPIVKNRYNARIACRFHGYDLYEHQYGGYIPYRNHILNNSDLYLPCSENGKQYLEQKMKISSHKIFVARIGVKQEGIAPFKENDILRIISCSDCVAVKRLHLVLEALRKIDRPVHWMHIGDGPTLRLIRKKAGEISNKHKIFTFPGYLSNADVYNTYLKEEFDLFLNVSKTEGVPVSIMEAMSVGLPIIATDVGGTREIVDSSNGVLVNENISAVELAELLTQFKDRPVEEIKLLRINSLLKFEEKSDSLKNSEQLFEKLITYFS